VLITGASGFVGAALSRRLLAAGARASGVARRRPARDPGVELHTVDLSDLAACRELVARERPDVVLHTAGHPYASRDLASVVPTFRDNLQTTVNLLVATAGSGIARVVLCGSLEEPEADDAAAALSSPYALSKSAATGYARMFNSLYGLPVVVARLFMIYGPGQWALNKLIPGTILAMLRGEPPRIASAARPVDWVYIDDVVDGILACAVAPGVEGRRIDIGTGVLTTVSEVVATLGTLIPDAPAPVYGALPARRAEQVRAARVDQTLAQLQWAPAMALREGLERTVAWYRDVDIHAEV
jgi:nucleoside-diphosphate-sugar epimerase